ncbi:MAG TPA: transporter [Bacteroidales bacterium]|nr:transporter [Bacteroidales bacterium]
MVMYRAFLLLMFSAFSIISFSQDIEPVVLIGDRPDQTESAYLVPKGYLQFEDGFMHETVNDRITNISYSSMLLRYGLFNHFELRLGTDYNQVKSSVSDDSKGFSPLSVGGKLHVTEEKDWMPQIAFIGQIDIASTGAVDFRQKYHSTKMLLTFGHSLQNNLSIGYSIAVEFPENVNYTIGTYTFVAGYSISDEIGTFIEVYGDFSKYMNAQNKFNGGVTYLIHPKLQLDFAGGFGLSQYAPNNYFSFGLIYLFKPV